MDNTFLLISVIIMAAVTMGLRAIPFLIFGRNEEVPSWVTYLGKVLPYAIIGMLVVYCLRGIDFMSGTHGIPELIACAVVVILHAVKNNTLLSIIAGTVCYMVLLRVI